MVHLKEHTTRTVVVRLGVDSLVSFRLDENMKRWIDEEARRLGLTRSELLRVAIERFRAREDVETW